MWFSLINDGNFQRQKVNLRFIHVVWQQANLLDCSSSTAAYTKIWVYEQAIRTLRRVRLIPATRSNLSWQLSTIHLFIAGRLLLAPGTHINGPRLKGTSYGTKLRVHFYRVFRFYFCLELMESLQLRSGREKKRNIKPFRGGLMFPEYFAPP